LDDAHKDKRVLTGSGKWLMIEITGIGITKRAINDMGYKKWGWVF
jgi:hypothetical protein